MKKTVSILLALSMMLGIVPGLAFAADDLTAGLVLRYTFDSESSEPDVIVDECGSYNGQVINNSQDVNLGWGQQQTYTKKISVEDGAAFFPGIEAVTGDRGRTTTVKGAAIKIPYEAVAGLTDYTVSMWVKADSQYAYAANLQRFFDFGNSTTDSIFFRYVASSGDYRFQDRGIGTSADDSSSIISGTDSSFTDKWGLLTIAYTADSDETVIYINGKEASRDSGKLTRSIGDIDEASDDTYGLYLGRTQWHNEQLQANPDFCGYMDDVRIYSRAISASEAALLYSTTNPEAEKIPSSVTAPDGVVTLVGVVPTLPSTVRVDYTNGSSGQEEITWEDIAPEKYAAVGEFQVSGTVNNTSLTTSITIKVVSDPSESINAGMLLYYDFESDAAQPSAIKDVSGSGNDASVINNVSSGGWSGDVDNKIEIADGKAVFPGYTTTTFEWGGFTMTNLGAALLLPNDFNRKIDGDYTVSMWVNADSSYEFAGKTRIFDFGNRANGDYYNSIFARYDTSNEELTVWDRELNKNFGGTMEDQPFMDKWGLLTVTYSKAEEAFTLYINGKEFKSADGYTRTLADLGTLNDDSNGMFIGRTQWYSDGNAMSENPDFKGKMDDIRIYNRSLTPEEVASLYDKTNPERKIDVTVTTVVYGEEISDSGIIYSNEETVQVPANSVYDAAPEQTMTIGNEEYTLSQVLSVTKIAQVTDDNNLIKLVYAKMKPVSAEMQSVRTYKGICPVLPEKLTVTYQTGDTDEAEAEWEDIASDKYAKIGSFNVSGTAAGINVTVLVTVYGVKSASVAENVYAAFGESPYLPEYARVVFTDSENEFSEPVLWDSVTDEQISDGKDFEISGKLVNYPDVKVSTNVCFIVEAETVSEAIADTYTSTESGGSRNYGSETGLKITSTGGSGAAGYDRNVFLRFKGFTDDTTLGARVRMFVQYINNNRTTTYTLYAIDKEHNGWDESTLTWNTQDEFITDAQKVASATVSPSITDEWVEFDVTDYVLSNPGMEQYDFYISCDTCATYITSREAGENAPAIVYVSEGQLIEINYMYGDELLKSETAIAAKGQRFEYNNPRRALVVDGKAYSYKSGDDSIEAVDENNCTLTYQMKSANSISFEDITVSAYYDEIPAMPSNVIANIDGYEIVLQAEFEATAFDDIGVYTITGSAEGLEFQAQVKAYGRYESSSGITIGYASKIIYEFEDTEGRAYDPVEVIVKTGSALDVKAMTDYYPQLENASAEDVPSAVTEPVHTVVIKGTKVPGVSGYISASLSGSDPETYTVNVSAAAANTGDSASSARIIIVKYDENGRVIDFKTQNVDLEADMRSRKDFTAEWSYNRSKDEDIRIYIWDFGQLRPLVESIFVSELPDPQKYSDEIMALIPTYESVRENVIRANDYRQSTWGPTTWVNGIDPAFWDTAAYHTGNMETYFTFGNEDYKQYSTDWANDNNWMGNEYTGSKENWTWGYNQSQGSNAVLFGDWQICFQSYLDLNLLDPDTEKTARAEEVMGYQITKDNDDFWWWADALYMVAPVMTKMYLTTNNEDYLDALYKYYLYAAELMYDGESGIPNEGEDYKSSASLNNGASPTDPNNYANLFFRDAGYVYPLNPNSGHENEKNFWARGNGWVFAGLAKVLADLPSDYEHYDFFLTIYTEMAKAIIECQQQDEEGRGFWTQSMLQDYPKGSNDNDEGYETSGTAFLTYGLFWGLNSGVLDENTYLEPALRGWKYLSEVALQDDGKVGYCQPIGSNATQATAQSTDQPFGYGAFLIAGCEVSRWVGGVTENNLPYLKRKLWNSIAFNGGNYYADGEVIEGTVSFERDGEIYVPVEEFAGYMGLTATKSDSNWEIKDEINDKGGTIIAASIEEVDGVDYAPVDSVARLVGRHVLTYGSVTVIADKTAVFYDCDANSVALLEDMLK